MRSEKKQFSEKGVQKIQQVLETVIFTPFEQRNTYFLHVLQHTMCAATYLIRVNPLFHDLP